MHSYISKYIVVCTLLLLLPTNIRDQRADPIKKTGWVSWHLAITPPHYGT